jgi:tetratricopeptide (TPR) repeat protein
VLLGALIGAVFFVWGYHPKARGNRQSAMVHVESQDFGSQMVSYIKQGRYEEAIQVGLHAVQNQPSDEIVYEQIANVYLIRAQKDPDHREEWVTQAISYVEKSLSLNSKDKDLAGVHLFQDARSFEVAGDLSTGSRCIYYERARKLLEDRVPLLQGRQLTLEGRIFPLAPLRAENDKILDGVKGKTANAGCK